MNLCPYQCWSRAKPTVLVLYYKTLLPPPHKMRGDENLSHLEPLLEGKGRKIQNSRSSLMHKYEATLGYKRLGVKKNKEREKKEKEMLAGKKKE